MSTFFDQHCMMKVWAESPVLSRRCRIESIHDSRTIKPVEFEHAIINTTVQDEPVAYPADA